MSVFHKFGYYKLENEGKLVQLIVASSIEDGCYDIEYQADILSSDFIPVSRFEKINWIDFVELFRIHNLGIRDYSKSVLGCCISR